MDNLSNCAWRPFFSRSLLPSWDRDTTWNARWTRSSLPSSMSFKPRKPPVFLISIFETLMASVNTPKAFPFVYGTSTSTHLSDFGLRRGPKVWAIGQTC